MPNTSVFQNTQAVAAPRGRFPATRRIRSASRALALLVVGLFALSVVACAPGPVAGSGAEPSFSGYNTASGTG